MARQFGVHGVYRRKRQKPTVVRPKRQAGKNYNMPPSMADPWAQAWALAGLVMVSGLIVWLGAATVVGIWQGRLLVPEPPGP